MARTLTQGKGKKSHRWVDGNAGTYYRRFIKKLCEKCKSKKNLQIHHIDKNRRNNEKNNLLTVCSSCHTKIHKIGLNFTKNISYLNCITCKKKTIRFNGRQIYCRRCSKYRWTSK